MKKTFDSAFAKTITKVIRDVQDQLLEISQLAETYEKKLLERLINLIHYLSASKIKEERIGESELRNIIPSPSSGSIVFKPGERNVLLWYINKATNDYKRGRSDVF